METKDSNNFSISALIKNVHNELIKSQEERELDEIPLNPPWGILNLLSD